MRVGVLGYGSIGKRHVQNIKKMGHKVIVFDPACVDAMGPFSETLDDFFVSEMDALVIASPSHLHVNHLINRPRVPTLVEKPIGTEISDLRHLSHGKLDQVRVGNNLRFHPSVRHAKAWMPMIGKPIWADFWCAQYSGKPEYLRDGVTLNWGAHEIDLALYLLGPAQVGAACISEKDDIADITLIHENGCRSRIHVDYLTKPETRAFIVKGEDRVIMVKLLIAESTLEDSGILQERDFDWNQTYVDEMKDFLESGENCATAKDGIATLEIILEAKRKAGLS